MQNGKKKRKAVSANDLQKHPRASVMLFMLLSNVFDPRNVPWIAVVIIISLLPASDRKDIALTFINQGVLVVVILLAIIIIMSVVWFFTHRLDKIEIDRVSKERDELQQKLGSPIQSSEQ